MLLTRYSKTLIITLLTALTIIGYYYYVFSSIPIDQATGQGIQEVHTTQLVGEQGEVLTSNEKKEYLNNQPRQTPQAYPQQYARTDDYDPNILTTTITTTKTINNQK